MYFSCRYIYPISLYLLYQIYLEDTFREKPDMFLRDIPDCDDAGSKSISYKQIKS